MRPLKSRTLLCLIFSALLAQAPIHHARAQFPDEQNNENLFNDEVEDPPGGAQLNQNAPPPPPPAGDFNPAPPAGLPNTVDTGAPGGFGGASLGGGRGRNMSPTPGASASGANAGGASATTATKKSGSKVPIADAGLDEITNANYPDLIESFDYPNAEITDLVKAISQLTGKNFIIDPGVRGKISIVAPTQITVAEAYKAFLTALAINGFTVVPSGKFLKIKSARNAQRDSIETYSGEYYPNADAMITRIIHLKHISAEEVNKRLRILPSKDGEMTPYEPTNSIIISDYGANIERIMKIINELDKPGFEEQLAVMPIRWAKAKDLADLINQIINKSPTKGAASSPFGGAPGFGAAPTFRGGRTTGSGSPEELSLVASDDRTGAIIVVGNQAGIDKVRSLVKKLDYKLDPAEAGGVFVYYVRYGEAEKIQATISGLTGNATGATTTGSLPGQGFGGFNQQHANPAASQAVFGGDVKVTADKNTNSLVITASKQDYETVQNLLAKLDIPKDQVFVEAIIMEMQSNKKKTWNPTYYFFDPRTNGIARSGFSSNGSLSNILNPANDSGAILSFGGGSTFTMTLPVVGAVTVPSLLAFINILQQNTETNILSTPQILALDNETASIEVGDKVPVGQSSANTGTTTTTSTQFEQASIKLEITPFIRPDSDVVRLKIDQSVKQVDTTPPVGAALAANTTSISDREIKTNLVIHNGDTAVLGGLVHDTERLEETKIPVLGDIPVIGWLFKSRVASTDKSNLIVFLTPKIIRSLNDSHNVLTLKSNERIEWLKKNYDGRDPYGKVMDSLPRAEQAENEDINGGGSAPRDRESIKPMRSAPIRTDPKSNDSMIE